MIEVCRHQAELAGVAGLIDLRLGDLREPPVTERVKLVTCPFRAYLHLLTSAERLRALRAAHQLLVPGGRLVFDVFAPSPEDIEETHDRWIEREPGIWERARWNAADRTIELAVRVRGRIVTMWLEWLDADEWRDVIGRAGLRVVAAYSGFDGDRLDGLPGDHVFVCEAA
jgi:SAM-dependent methyltransferase